MDPSPGSAVGIVCNEWDISFRRRKMYKYKCMSSLEAGLVILLLPHFFTRAVCTFMSGAVCYKDGKRGRGPRGDIQHRRLSRHLRRYRKILRMDSTALLCLFEGLLLSGVSLRWYLYVDSIRAGQVTFKVISIDPVRFSNNAKVFFFFFAGCTYILWDRVTSRGDPIPKVVITQIRWFIRHFIFLTLYSQT